MAHTNLCECTKGYKAELCCTMYTYDVQIIAHSYVHAEGLLEYTEHLYLYGDVTGLYEISI